METNPSPSHCWNGAVSRKRHGNTFQPACSYMPRKVTSTMSILVSEGFQKWTLLILVWESALLLKGIFSKLVYSERGFVFKCHSPNPIFHPEIQQTITLGLHSPVPCKSRCSTNNWINKVGCFFSKKLETKNSKLEEKCEVLFAL